MFLEISQNSQENSCAKVSFNFIKKETLAQVFSSELCEIFKNTFFTEYLRTTASVKRTFYSQPEKFQERFTWKTFITFSACCLKYSSNLDQACKGLGRTSAKNSKKLTYFKSHEKLPFGRVSYQQRSLMMMNFT